VGGQTTGGNFWGNPSGTGFSETTPDANRDGICDRPFAINSGNSDLLPLARTSVGGTVAPTGAPTLLPSSTATIVPTLSSTPSPTVTATSTTAVPQSPFPAARVLPRTVEAEHFDAGGNGVAYHDYEAANQGNSNLRPGEGVDIDTYGGITNIGYTRDGESLEYTVDATTAGSFVLTLYAANPDPATKAVKVYLDGAPAIQVPVAPTGGWTTYQGFAGSAPLVFSQGRHVVTIAFEGVSRINLDRLDFSTAAPPAPTTVAPTLMDTPPPVAFPTSTATPTVKPELQNATLPALPGTTSAPRDPDNDGRYEDINGNGRIDFSDVTLLFNNLDTVATTYPPATFDFNTNGRTDYGDVTVLYGRL
jgi:PKD repeat protein